MRRSHVWLAILVGVLLFVNACAAQSRVSNVLSGSAQSSTARIPPEDVEDTGWQQVDQSLEWRQVRVHAGKQNGDLAIIRLDPAVYHVRVAYDSAHPGRVSEWAKAVEPVALINGGYFDENNRATALVIFDGIARGASYEGFGGMVVVDGEGKFELRSLRQQPYDPAEPLQQAMQSSPMLIQPGGTLSDIEADEERSRRSVIARDRQGRILLIACDWPAFTLKELAVLLQASDLDLDAALNLDGGRSTGLYLNASSKQFMMDSFEAVPLVLVVEKL